VYVVAKGYSFSTPRGILLPGDEIAEKDFFDKKAFLKRVKNGSIVAGKSRDQLAKEEAEERIAAGDKAAKAEAARRARELEDAALKVQTAEAALKTAKDTLEAARNTAAEARKNNEAQSKVKIDGLEAAVRNAEDALKATKAEADKAKGGDKTDAEGRVLAAQDTLTAANEALTIAKAEADTPEYRAACAAVESAEDGVIDAEANLEEAKEEAAKIK
jgi:hypothetical protein